MKKNILVIVPALMPSVNIGIINPMQHLQQKGKVNFKVTLPYLFKSKMLDNIDSTEEGRKLKKQFFDNYNANIESSFNTFDSLLNHL